MSATYIPNTFMTPNAIIDVLMPLLTDGEFRVLMFITRHILGWEKGRETCKARISQSVMENGYSYQDKQGNKRQIQGCGLSKNPIRNALKSLQKYRIIEAIDKPTNDGQEWELSLLTKDDPDIEGLKLRQELKAQKAKKQTKKARENSPKNNPELLRGISSTDTPKGGELTDSRGISSTDSQGGELTDTNETHEETHKETTTTAAAQSIETPQSVESPVVVPVEEKEPFNLNFVKVKEMLEAAISGTFTSQDLQLLKEDSLSYSLDHWHEAIETYKRNRETKLAHHEGNIIQPYKYILAVLKNMKAEQDSAQQRATAAAQLSIQRTIEQVEKLEQLELEIKAQRAAQKAKEGESDDSDQSQQRAS